MRVGAQESRQAYVFLSPLLTVLVGLAAYPLLDAVWTSFTSRGIGRPGAFVGLNNFVRLARDPVYWIAMIISIWLASVWQGLPFFIMMFLGAMMTIPPELHEAAVIDGAGAWARFRHVTIPSIRDVIATTVMLSTIWTFNSFNTVYVLTGGGPANRTQILPTLAYQYGLQRGELGQGSAVLVSVLPIFVDIIVLLTRRMLRDKGVG